MRFPLTYYVIFEYKNEQESHQFTTSRLLTQEMIEQEIEHFVTIKFGHGADVSKIEVKSYHYHEND